MDSETYTSLFRKKAVKTLLVLLYLVCINLLAGYIAVWLRFPSLWGNSQIFLDYAMPFGLTWALSHWPSMILFSILLLLLPHWNTKSIQRFRIICLCLFLPLLYGVLEKIPFALFPAVDLLIAFFFSLVIFPPTYKKEPKSFICLLLFLMLVLTGSVYSLYSKWSHRVPEIKESKLMDGLFELKMIKVDTNYKELQFTVELTEMIPQERICDRTVEMGEILFNAYQFDSSYSRMAHIIFNPKQTDNKLTPYPLGEIEQYDEAGELQIACYLKYK